jgi:hypothetical protein
MSENRRVSERFTVSLYVEQVKREAAKIRILNLSSSGFLVRGECCAGQGGIFHASFRVRPASGEMRVTTRGTVVHAHRGGAEPEYGIKIDGFGSPEQEGAYQAYVRELAERSAASQEGPSKAAPLERAAPIEKSALESLPTNAP